MKRLIILSFLLSLVSLLPPGYAGEDAGLAAGAWAKAKANEAAIAALAPQSGSEVLIETATTTYFLPFDDSTDTVTISSGSVSMADFWVTAQASSTASAYTVRLSATYDGFNGELTLIGSSSEIIQDRNADGWSIYTDEQGHVVASVPANVRGRVLKTEITTMEGD